MCNTTLNNGTGISWTRDGGAISNSMVESIPTSSNGLRLTGITSASHLGVYFCLDNYSNTSVSINITQGELKYVSMMISFVRTNGAIQLHE